MKSNLKKWGLAVLNLVYPLHCAVCKSDLKFDDSNRICKPCMDSIKEIEPPICRTCGEHLLDTSNSCVNCRRLKNQDVLIRSCSPYEGVLKEAIHQFKYSGRDYLGEDLIYILNRGWMRYPEIRSAELISWIPMHASSFRERGYNQSEILARELAQYINLPLTNTLKRTRKTKNQIQLLKEDREANLESAFAAVHPEEISKKRILLVDDVCTTGSTLRECAKTLLKAGASEISALTLTRQQA